MMPVVLHVVLGCGPGLCWLISDFKGIERPHQHISVRKRKKSICISNHSLICQSCISSIILLFKVYRKQTLDFKSHRFDSSLRCLLDRSAQKQLP